MKLEKILSPITIGSLTLKNRIVMPAMGTGYAAEDGTATDRLIDYFVARARGGAGLLTVEATAVHPLGRIFLGECCIFDDSHIPGFQKLTCTVHEFGAKIAIQLAHGGRQTKSALIGAQPMGPSAIPAPALCTETPKALSLDEIHSIVKSFGEAARRAKEAGFDAVEIHGAHGYLINQFFASNANHRNDGYGGTLENRARFAKEVIWEIKKAVNHDIPVFFRLSGEDYLEGGVTIDEAVAFAPILVQAGTDVLHVSAGVYGSYPPTIPLTGSKLGCFIPLALAVKKVVDIPVIAAGRIKSLLLAEEILTEGSADLIAMGRALIADPDLPQKTKEHRLEEIRPCVGCGQACIETLLNGIKKVKNEPIGCVVNPTTGREESWAIHPASKRRRLLVIGGGPGGIHAALTAAQRGHEVILCEAKTELGGNLRYLAMIPGKEEFSEYLDYLLREINRSGTEVILNRSVDLESVQETGAELVILATGASFKRVETGELDPDQVFTVSDVFEGNRNISNHVLVLGASRIGLELAFFLRKNGKEVTVIEEGDHLAADMGSIGRFVLLRTLIDEKVELLKDAKIVHADNSRIDLMVQGKARSVKGNFSLISVEQVPNNTLSEGIVSTGLTCHVIGDALDARMALEAIEEGYHAGLRV